MDKLVKRITLIKRSGTETEAVPIYREPKKRRRKLSRWASPLERATRKLLKSEITFGEEALRRQNKSNRRRRDGWIMDAPVIVFRSGRKAYNAARKAVPFRILPKA